MVENQSVSSCMILCPMVYGCADENVCLLQESIRNSLAGRDGILIAVSPGQHLNLPVT